MLTVFVEHASNTHQLKKYYLKEYIVVLRFLEYFIQCKCYLVNEVLKIGKEKSLIVTNM